MCLLTAVLLVFQPNPVKSALLLLLNFIFLSVLFLLLDAPFLAAIQVVIYAGAMMVLFLFVIMTSDAGNIRENETLLFQRPFLYAVCFVLALKLIFVLSGARSLTSRSASAELGSLTAYARLLLSTYLLPFELLSFILLIGIVGVLRLSKQK